MQGERRRVEALDDGHDTTIAEFTKVVSEQERRRLYCIPLSPVLAKNRDAILEIAVTKGVSLVLTDPTRQPSSRDSIASQQFGTSRGAGFSRRSLSNLADNGRLVSLQSRCDHMSWVSAKKASKSVISTARSLTLYP